MNVIKNEKEEQRKRTSSEVTRFQASALEMAHASPRMGSQMVKKLHGVAPVMPLHQGSG